MKTHLPLDDLALRYTRLFESSQDGILILRHPDGVIEDANPFICQLLAIRKEEIVGKRLMEFCKIADKTKIETYLKVFLKEGYVRFDDLDIVSCAGEEERVEFICSSYPVDGSTVIQCNTREISSRKNAEAALAASHLEAVAAVKAKLVDQMYETIDSLTKIIEARDPYTLGHQKRVSDLATAIAKEMGLSKTKLDCIRLCSLIHDIGKISIQAEILCKTSALTPLEVAMLKSHVQFGVDVIKPLTFPWPVTEIILQHHERLDGSGYPRSLKGNDICIEARIIGLADTVEAISSARPYRPAKDINAALMEIEESRGRLYDERVVDTCLSLFRSKSYKFPEFKSPIFKRL